MYGIVRLARRWRWNKTLSNFFRKLPCRGIIWANLTKGGGKFRAVKCDRIDYVETHAHTHVYCCVPFSEEYVNSHGMRYCPGWYVDCLGSRLLLKKLIVTKLVKKFPLFYKTRLVAVSTIYRAPPLEHVLKQMTPVRILKPCSVTSVLELLSVLRLDLFCVCHLQFCTTYSSFHNHTTGCDHHVLICHISVCLRSTCIPYETVLEHLESVFLYWG